MLIFFPPLKSAGVFAANKARIITYFCSRNGA